MIMSPKELLLKLNNLSYLHTSIARLDISWQRLLLEEYCYNTLIKIDANLIEMAKNNIIYPPQELIFNTLFYTPINTIKVVILGQDPYHGKSQANGLAFSVDKHIKLPPSLRNICKELISEYKDNTTTLDGTNLYDWAKQGVLLLNSCLTVIRDQPNSMKHLGWDIITDTLISHISDNLQHLVFMLWGQFAQQKTVLIDQKKHLLLCSSHPSPFSANHGFMGCNHFKLANNYLQQHNKSTISWL